MLYYYVYLVVFATVAHGSAYSGSNSRCSAQEFTCADGACVTRESRCDGAQHCADNSDEQDCGPRSFSLGLPDFLLHRSKRHSTCKKSDFRCRDGACISFDKKCDGVADCPDESDETLALCRNTRCSPHLFRCSYGACVDGTAPCNNVTDCADNSDELMPKCRSEKRELRGLFTCKNGETIPSTKLCDGKADCIDSSDESLDSCAGKRCVSYYFQCAYGACVDNGAACNGKDECFDGSDESDELCNRTTPTTCVLPKYPANGAYSVIGLPQARPGQRYKFIHLEVTCDPGFILVGDPVNFCYGANQWIRSMPKCSRACKLTPDPSVTYACKLTGAGVLSGTQTCREYEPDGTIVVPTCNSPNYYYDGYLSNMICKEGSWDHVATCNPGTGNTNAVVNDVIHIYISGVDYLVTIGKPQGTEVVVSNGTHIVAPVVFSPPSDSGHDALPDTDKRHEELDVPVNSLADPFCGTCNNPVRETSVAPATSVVPSTAAPPSKYKPFAVYSPAVSVPSVPSVETDAETIESIDELDESLWRLGDY